MHTSESGRRGETREAAAGAGEQVLSLTADLDQEVMAETRTELTSINK